MAERRITSDHSESHVGAPFAVVTGASSGIGFEIAKEFARRGFDLLITAESDRIERAASELRSSRMKAEDQRKSNEPGSANS